MLHHVAFTHSTALCSQSSGSSIQENLTLHEVSVSLQTCAMFLFCVLVTCLWLC